MTTMVAARADDDDEAVMRGGEHRNARAHARHGDRVEMDRHLVSSSPSGSRLAPAASRDRRN
jgi:hypothetical protein